MEESRLRALLAADWGLTPSHVEPLTGGMNSATWQVTDSGRRWAVKLVVPRDATGFRAGLHAAVLVEAGGIPAGAPLRTTAGRVSRTLPEGEIAVLGWVAGRALDRTGDNAALMGATLGRVHTVLAGRVVPEAPSFDWIDVGAAHLDVEPWVRPAVSEVLEEWAGTRSRVATWGFVHGDPAPEAFVQDPSTGPCGLIDWAGGVHGPCLYDVASAAMYVGPDAAPDLLAAYSVTGPVDADELKTGLPVLLRLRYAVQADYFARRLHENDLTGIDDAGGNHEGLDNARDFLGQ